MNYSTEEIYSAVGSQDKTATISFKIESDSYKLYGPYITVIFIYNQFEREALDESIKNPQNKTAGKVKAKFLGSELEDEKVLCLAKEGINSEDISSILSFRWDEKNTFHSSETRAITKINIPIHKQAKGRDYDWMYGVAKKMVNERIGLSPKERAFYLAGKLYYESQDITLEERGEIFQRNEILNQDIEWELLSIKYQREEVTGDDIKRIGEMIKQKDNTNMDLLDSYLKEAGSSLSRLTKEDIDTATRLLIRLDLYKERHFNVIGKMPIYLNTDRYLHVYMRHVEELKFNERFVDKTNFQWIEDDVLMVIQKVVAEINDEIQLFFEKHQSRRYSRWGKKSVYFEGDYYTLHIESNGSISTFYKNRKKHEEKTAATKK